MDRWPRGSHHHRGRRVVCNTVSRYFLFSLFSFFSRFLSLSAAIPACRHWIYFVSQKGWHTKDIFWYIFSEIYILDILTFQEHSAMMNQRSHTKIKWRRHELVVDCTQPSPQIHTWVLLSIWIVVESSHDSDIYI